MPRPVTVSSSSRLRRGVGILASMKTLDTKRVDDRLNALARVQEGLLVSQTALDIAEAKVKDARDRIDACDEEQCRAVEVLARALVADGQPRDKPFAAFGGPPPGKLKALPALEEAAAIHALAAEVKRSSKVSPAVIDAATAADRAAAKVELAAAGVPKLEATAAEARALRDSRQLEWDEAESALRRLARLVEEEGGGPLYSRGFPRRAPTSPRAAKPAKQASPQAKTSEAAS